MSAENTPVVGTHRVQILDALFELNKARKVVEAAITAAAKEYNVDLTKSVLNADLLEFVPRPTT